jgi:hypothetical protein
VKKGLPLCLIGDSGTGKSHLLIALGTEGGYSLAWWTCDRGHLPVWVCMFSIWMERS